MKITNLFDCLFCLLVLIDSYPHSLRLVKDYYSINLLIQIDNASLPLIINIRWGGPNRFLSHGVYNLKPKLFG